MDTPQNNNGNTDSKILSWIRSHRKASIAICICIPIVVFAIYLEFMSDPCEQFYKYTEDKKASRQGDDTCLMQILMDGQYMKEYNRLKEKCNSKLAKMDKSEVEAWCKKGEIRLTATCEQAESKSSAGSIDPMVAKQILEALATANSCEQFYKYTEDKKASCQGDDSCEMQILMDSEYMKGYKKLQDECDSELAKMNKSEVESWCKKGEIRLTATCMKMEE